MAIGKVNVSSTQWVNASRAAGAENGGNKKLHQATTSHASQSAAGSLAGEGRNHASRTNLRQAPPAAQDEMPARQRGRGSKLGNFLHGFSVFKKKSAEAQPAKQPEPQKTAAAYQPNSLLAKMAEERPSALTHGRTIALDEKPSADEVRHYQHNFSQVRQNILKKIGRASGDEGFVSGSSHYYTPPSSMTSSGYLSSESLDSLPADMFDDDGAVDQLYRDMLDRQAGQAPKVFDPVAFYGLEPEPAASTSAEAADDAQLDDDGMLERLHRQMTERQAGKPPKVFDPTLAPPKREPFQPSLSPIKEKPYEGAEEASSRQREVSGQQLEAGPATQPLNVSLDDKGRLAVHETASPALQSLLQQTLGKDNQRFLSHMTRLSDEGDQQHLLLGKEGKLFALNRSPNAYTAIHSSVPAAEKKTLELAGKGKANYTLHADADNGIVSMRAESKHRPGGSSQSSLPLPGRLHESLLTGIYRHPSTATNTQGAQVRLHGGKLHELNEALDVWQKKSDIAFDKLSAQADNKLYAIRNKHTLSNLTDGAHSEKFVNDIAAFAVNKRGQAAVLVDTDDRARVCFMPSLDAAPEHRVPVILKLADPALALVRGSEHIEAQTIGMADNQFYVSDSEGKLFVGDYPRLGQDELTLKPAPQPKLEQAFSKNYHIEGFASDEYGQLNALVKDNLKQTHACPLGKDNQFTPGWNLTDALVLDNQLGLTHIQPTELETVGLQYQGKLTLQEGTLYYHDSLTHAWTKAEDGCAQLKKGSDGQAYILKDGEVKKLSINHQSSTLRQGTDNIFSLPHVRNKPELGKALLPEAKKDNATAMAVINAQQFLVASEQGDIHFHQVKPGTKQSLHPAHVVPKTGINGEIKDISLDRHQNLYALTRQGDVFTLPQSQWRKPPGEQGQIAWEAVSPPNVAAGEISHIQNDDAGNLVVSQDAVHHRLTDNGWHSLDTVRHAEPPPIESRSSETVYNRLNNVNKRVRLPGSGLTAQGTIMKGGFTGTEGGAVKSKFAERLSAHVFSPTLSVPRPVKNLAYAVQHQWQGREGLKSLYQMQSALLKQLEGGNIRKSAVAITPVAAHAEAVADLRTRLDRLDLGEKGTELISMLQRFRSELEESATLSVTRLGQHKGIVKDNGELNEGFKPSPLKNAAQSLNPNRSGRDLSKSLLDAWRSAPAAKDSKVETLLSAFVDKKVNISHQKADIALGRQRDPNDQNSLLKSRLVLDTLTLKDLHQLVDKAELLSGKAPDEQQISQLRQEVTQLRDGQYGQNPIKQFTDMGFSGDSMLEADYDAVKAFLNAFRKENHGLNVTAKTVLDASHQAELESKLVDTLKSMGEGDVINFERSYGGGASAAYVFLLKNSPLPVVPGGGMTFNRVYGLTMTRLDNSLYVEFNRRGDTVGNVSMATGFNLLPELLPKSIKEKVSAISINDHYNLMPDLRINGSMAGALTKGSQKGLAFTLTDEELPDFVKGLTQGTLNPAELMQKGVQHLVRSGDKISFSLDISSSLEARAAVNLGANIVDPATSQSRAPFPETLTRASLGVGAGLNVLSATRERTLAEGENAINRTYTDNRVRFFNRVDMDAHAGINAGAIFPIEDGNADDPNDLVPIFVGSGASANLTIDSSVNKMVDMTMKRAEPVIDDDVTELTVQLSKHFKDSASRQVLAALPDVKDVGEKLRILNNHFIGQEINSDERYEALNNVKSAFFQHQIAQDGGMMAAGITLNTTYNNLSRLDNNGMIHAVRKFLDASLPPTNSDRLKALMASTPELNRAIESIKQLPGTNATIGLELKEPLKQKIIEGIQQKKVEHQDIANLFNDRNNLRLSYIAFYQTAKKREGFDTPTLVFGGSSSASVSMSKNIGTIAFKYGQDQSVPRGFTLDGDIAKANPTLANAMYQLKNEGMEMKS
ncbi:AvrE-family type 3 secretion system effector [Brenneria izadpanahii]|uniref:AvrE-family type 3 secretion system effector n=1 Tax=Brenneria izadpanahii TaxID=2722756 RepID=A0ABX7UY93_9GAMM|nr:AvrE-family type 3 secretion system effector [Brenneria izadpanahii]QTF09552.1 AvrE-family type 3 secretion system effector [Brenneria izadpanahii]